jgi:hypothetical protein
VADRSGRRQGNIRNQQIDFAMRVEQPKTVDQGADRITSFWQP